MDESTTFIQERVFFNVLTDEEAKKEITRLILEVARRIERKSQADWTAVQGNIEFIICKEIIETGHSLAPSGSPDEGFIERIESGTHKSTWRLFIIYSPNRQRFPHQETQLYILAHEFAHAFYGHPFQDSEERKQLKEHSELEADKKAVEWGFRPHDDDVGEFPRYQKHLSLGLL